MVVYTDAITKDKIIMLLIGDTGKEKNMLGSSDTCTSAQTLTLLGPNSITFYVLYLFRMSYMGKARYTNIKYQLATLL